jgi:hypothetical protein
MLSIESIQLCSPLQEMMDRPLNAGHLPMYTVTLADKLNSAMERTRASGLLSSYIPDRK